MRLPTGLTALAASAALIGFTTPSHAGWAPGGATMLSTTSILRPLVACEDASHGTFVAWQEEQTGSSSGTLRVQHVLPSGDLDPAWPAGGANASDAVAARSLTGALPDRLGGAYVWWKEGDALYVNRIGADGTVAAGWPARGRSMGNIYSATPAPSFIEDGAHGFYAAWSSPLYLSSDVTLVRAFHIGPSNTAAGGWPSGGRAITPTTSVSTLEVWPQLALADDGGVFVAWASWSADNNEAPGDYRLRRLTAAGLDAPGWTLDGVSFGTFRGDLIPISYNQAFKSSAIGLSPDGRGGVFLFLGKITGFDEGYGQATMDVSLRRLLGDGTSDPAWPAEGRTFSNGPGYYVDAGTDASLRVLNDGVDGAIVTAPVFYDHATNIGVRNCSAAGVWSPAGWWADQAKLQGYDLSLRGDGGIYLAGFNPDGPYSYYDDNAFLSVSQTPQPSGWVPFGEYHDQPVIFWFGDIALAPTGDGGAVFFWSQAHDRFGLFARRFGPGGEVTGVGDRPALLSLRGLRFAAGQGVRASVSLPGGAARLDLYDVAGRRVASDRMEGAGTRDITLAGTAGLRAGLYFARLDAGRQSHSGKVVVSR